MPESKPHSVADLVELIKRGLDSDLDNDPESVNLHCARVALRDLEEQLEALRVAAVYAEEELRKYGTGAGLIGARHRLCDALALVENPAYIAEFVGESLAASNTLDRKSEKTWGPERMRHDPL